MIIKHPDDKSWQMAELQKLSTVASGDVKHRIEQEIRTFQAGINGERDSTYLINFHYGKSNSRVPTILPTRPECG